MRVLVIDDEDRLAAAVSRGLVAEGFVVDTAADGVNGLQQARFGDYDAVICDVMLPGLSGFEVVRRLRAESNWVPILMLSAKDGEHDQADALDDGADDYLTKPFSFVVLVARLRALLRRGVVARPAVLSAGDITLDPATREVTVAQVPVTLTPREFVLLEYLLRQGGRAVGKLELLDHVWDSAADTGANAVEVYVGYLRRKIGAERLLTVRGAGYRLAAIAAPDPAGGPPDDPAHDHAADRAAGRAGGPAPGPAAGEGRGRPDDSRREHGPGAPPARRTGEPRR